jgi:hypothetical protein
MSPRLPGTYVGPGPPAGPAGVAAGLGDPDGCAPVAVGEVGVATVDVASLLGWRCAVHAMSGSSVSTTAALPQASALLLPGIFTIRGQTVRTAR